jgi:hypothetical protein
MSRGKNGRPMSLAGSNSLREYRRENKTRRLTAYFYRCLHCPSVVRRGIHANAELKGPLTGSARLVASPGADAASAQPRQNRALPCPA